jgi:hypothetical protein
MQIEADITTQSGLAKTDAYFRLRRIEITNSPRQLVATFDIKASNSSLPNIPDLQHTFIIDGTLFENQVIPRITGSGSLIAGLRNYVKNQLLNPTDLDGDDDI